MRELRRLIQREVPKAGWRLNGKGFVLPTSLTELVEKLPRDRAACRQTLEEYNAAGVTV